MSHVKNMSLSLLDERKRILPIAGPVPENVKTWMSTIRMYITFLINRKRCQVYLNFEIFSLNDINHLSIQFAGPLVHL